MNAINLAATEQPTTTLAVLPASAVSTVISADKNDILGKLRQEINGFEGDCSTPKGRAEIASKARKVAVAKMDLKRLAATLKEGAQKTIKSVNAEERIIEERMDALRDQVRKPLDDYEAVESARIARHEAALTEIALAVVFALPEPTATQIELRLATLQDATDRDWQEFGKRASDTHAVSFDRLNAMLAAATRRAEEQAELARLRAEAEEAARQAAIRAQAERDRQIAAQAAEQARLDAERRSHEAAAAERQRVETERLAAERKAERERQAAVDREAALERQARQAEADRLAAIEQARLAAEAAERRAKEQRQQAEWDRAAAVQAEQQRVADLAAAEARETERRARDKAHRATFNREAVADLAMSAGLSQDEAQAVIVAIAKGAVRHVSIGY